MRRFTVLLLLPLLACPDPVKPSTEPDGCVPRTCTELSAECGQVADPACGGTVSCGDCTAPKTCGGNGTPNRCEVPGCVAETDTELCAKAKVDCGSTTLEDRCKRARTVTCGTCKASLTCGGGGAPNRCGCAVEPDRDFCVRFQRECGEITGVDLCGVLRTLDCGGCTAPQLCGGAGVPGHCGTCSKTETDSELCARVGFVCGALTAPDLCGQERTVSCGACPSPKVCGGGGTAGTCGDACARPETDQEFCSRLESECGTVEAVDLCGQARTVDCGACPSGQTCGAGSTPGHCGACVPESDEQLCAHVGRNCGPITTVDSCGASRSVDCGACTAPETCGGAGKPGVCGAGCTAETDAALCLRLAKNCGSLSATDNCGTLRTVECGSCTAPETCAGGGTANVCGFNCPDPETDAALCLRLAKNCGSLTAVDTCGRTRTVASCGTCTAPDVCGGVGKPNVCGDCNETDAQLCARVQKTCGPLAATDLCGKPRSIDCGTCTAPEACGGGGVANVCAPCTALEPEAPFCARLGKNCGAVTGTDVCGNARSVNCGACLVPQGCGQGGTPNVCGCTPKTCAGLGRTCGKVPDDCGGELDCGACANPPPYCIRVMAANITSGNNQSYDPGEGIRIFQGLKPDVVAIQEFNYGNKTAASMRQMVDTAFGTNFWYFREPGDQIPNGVVSRFPILASGEWSDSYAPNRDYVWARIDVPGPRDLWVVSLHLLTSDTGTRNSEAKEIVAAVKANVPAGDFLIIGGDFNTGSRSESCITTFSQVVSTSQPYPVDNKGNGNTSAKRSNPLDWLLANSLLRAEEGPVVIGSKSFPTGLVFDSRVYTPLADVAPVQSGDSGATAMQHMGVVREFCLPLE